MVYLSLLLGSVDPFDHEWNSVLEAEEKPYIKPVCRKEEIELIYPDLQEENPENTLSLYNHFIIWWQFSVIPGGDKQEQIVDDVCLQL